jgi:hypothetical protein
MTSSRWPRVFQPRTFLSPLTILILCLTSGATRTWTAQPNSDKSKATTVNCGAGQSINHALSHSKPGETILIQGTCHERVVITQAVTLDGAGSAIIDGGGVQAVDPEFDGLVVIDGVTGVNLVGLTIQNGAVNGIFAAHGAAVVLRNVTTQANALVGIIISDNSTAEAIDSVTRANGSSGFDVFTSSSLILRGTFDTSNNGANGGEINGQSMVELRGAQVTVSNNPAIGIIAGSRSQLAIFGFKGALGSTLNVSGSGFAGIGIADSSLTIFSDAIVTATNNGAGLFAATGTLSAPFGGATFVLHDNGVGMNLSLGSSALLTAGLNVHDNATGILVEEASLSMAAPPGLPNSITGNGTDVQLSFGARSTIENFAIGTPLVCDATVLSRGTTKCP